MPVPTNFYGDSKLQADFAVRKLADDKFKVIVLRPPMIYGKDSKGNYPTLAILAKRLLVFPDVDNERSMLHVGNFCEFLCQIMLVKVKQNAIVLIPQNAEWTKTSEMVEKIAEVSEHRIIKTKLLNPIVYVASKISGRIKDAVNKAFGNICYAHTVSVYEGINYQVTSLEESIKKTEGKNIPNGNDCRAMNRPKALILASVASMIDQFNMQNIQLLLDNGYDVDVVCNCKIGNTISDERVQGFISRLTNKGVSVIHVPIPRKITNIKYIVDSYLFVRRLCDVKQYRILHCHSPIGSVIARLAAKKSRIMYGTKVIYTAHGFHFYKGAPKKNWMVYYPIERVCSKLTDTLITINREDYEFAKIHMKACEVKYIPGVGIDTAKFQIKGFDKAAKRKELGISENDIMILSVGELNQNKNQEVIVKAISRFSKDRVHYFIAGRGDKERYLIELATSLGVNLHLLGYRTDVVELLNAADIFAHPSFREGLSVALMEAMAAGLPCMVSKIRGNVDLIEDDKGGYLYDPTDIEEIYIALKKLSDSNKRRSMAEYNRLVVQEFDIHGVIEKMRKVYFNKTVGEGCE